MVKNENQVPMKKGFFLFSFFFPLFFDEGEGRIIKWVSKRAGIEQLSIEWELGSENDGYIAGQVTYAEPEVSDLSKPSASMGKFLTDAQYAFTLEPYVNGTPAPTLVTKEVDMAVAAPFLLVNPDFSKTEVVKTYAHTIVLLR